jgi:tetratricopeptide (TPR) repeat protein
MVSHALFHHLLRIVHGAAIERSEERTRAWAMGAECLRLYQDNGDAISVALVHMHLGQVALCDGDYARSRTLFASSLPMIRAQGWRSTVAEALAGLADAAREQGAYDETATLYAEALRLYRELGDQHMPVYGAVLGRLFDVAFEQGDWTAAKRHAAESLAVAQEAGQEGSALFAQALEAHAALAAVTNAPDRAVCLAGAAAALRGRLHPAGTTAPRSNEVVHLALTHHRLNRPLTAGEQATLERRLAPARQALSAKQQATAWAQGQAMTREQALADALAGPPSAQGTPLRRV